MAEDGFRDGGDVGRCGMEAAPQNGVGFGSGDQGNPSTWTRTPADHFLHEIRSFVRLRSGGAGEACGEINHVVTDGDAFDDSLKPEDFLGVE